MRAKLSRIDATSNSGRTRTNDIVGEYSRPPTVGEHFNIVGKPIDATASMRLWSTSRVVECTMLEGDDSYSFKTESGSIYLLDPHE